MTFKSISLDPLSDHDERTQTNADGSTVTRSANGEIIRTVDVLGVKREYSREFITGKLMLQRFGGWIKLTDACLDQDGTLMYRQDQVDIQEKLDGVHIHVNTKSQVSIQTDHLRGVEIVRQPHGEVWRRETNADGEVFEIYVQASLKFRSETLNQSVRQQACTPFGSQALVNVSRREQSCESGQLVREKYTFTNPLNQQRDVMLTLQCAGAILIVKKVVSVVTQFVGEQAQSTVYQMSAPADVRYETAGRRQQYQDVTQVREILSAAGARLLLCNSQGQQLYL